MDELEFWLKISRKLKVNQSKFEKIKRNTKEAYKKLHQKINETKEILTTAQIDNMTEFIQYENYIFELSQSIQKQDILIMIYSLNVLLPIITEKISTLHSKTKLKQLLNIIQKIILRLLNTNYLEYQEISRIAVQKIEELEIVAKNKL